MCLKIQLCLEMWFSTSVDARWYAEAAKYAKNLLSTLSIVSWWSLMNDRGSVRVKLTKCDKIEWSEKCHYASDIPLEWLHVWFVFYCHIILYWEKVTSYEKLSHNLTFEIQIVWKISAF